MRLTILFISLIGFQCALYAQQPLPLIRAKSKDLIVKDGLHTVGGVLVPEAKPDLYCVDYPRKAQRVSIHTDLDSIVFNTEYGNNYDCIILLNEKDSCHLRVSAEARTSPLQSMHTSDTLPFTIRNNRIFFEGRINGALGLIQFDLGASSTNINHRSVAKIPVNFDAETHLINSDGYNLARASTQNTIEIGPLKWTDNFMVETKNMERWEDVIVGNNLFLDKIIEIDYDQKHLIVHQDLPNLDASYEKNEMILDGGVRPCMQFAMEIDGKIFKSWYLFDTGNTGNGIIRNSKNVYDKMTKLIGMGNRRVAVLPTLMVGQHKFKNLIFMLEKPNPAQQVEDIDIMGNAILNRFNVVIDNQQGHIYMKTNGLINQPLETSGSVGRKVGLGVGIAALIAVAIYVIRRK